MEDGVDVEYERDLYLKTNISIITFICQLMWYKVVAVKAIYYIIMGLLEDGEYSYPIITNVY